MGSFKTVSADLLDDVVSVYDQTKTTIQGRVLQKTVDGDSVLGPPFTKFIDVVTDTGQTPIVNVATENNRMFVGATPVNGTVYDTMPILLYDFDLDTGSYSYVGRVDVQLPNRAATTHTVRGFKIIDDGTTGWKLYIATTATILVNGGLFLVNNLALSDFVPIGFPTIPMATSTDSKAVYMLQDPSNIGVSQLNVAAAGVILDKTNDRVYIHNGVSATHQYYVYDTAIAPVVVPEAVSVSVASPGIVSHAGHTFLDNDIVLFSSGTLPTGLVLNEAYFVRSSVPGVSYQLSATSGGASINTTGSPSVSAQIVRAWGTTGSNFIHKTGNLTALSGTLLVTNSEYKAIPTNSPINGGVLNGNECAFFATSSAIYLGLLSELTSGAVSWPSLATSNMLGSVNQIIAPTATHACWSDVLDAATYQTQTFKFVTKQLENNAIRSIAGDLDNRYYETFNFETVRLALAASVSMDMESGWLFVCSGATAGQRGIIAIDYRSDQFYDYSYIVTKVLDTPDSQLKFIAAFEKLQNDTGSLKVQYRTSGFGSISGGWTDLDYLEDISSVSNPGQIQFKILFRIQSSCDSSPTQISDFMVTLQSNTAISDNWEYSHDDSSPGNPSIAAFRLKKIYASSVPQLFFRAHDLSNNLFVLSNTTANAGLFQYSTDGGVNWLALGTIPNTVGTLIRYTFAVAPGVDVRPSIRES